MISKQPKRRARAVPHRMTPEELARHKEIRAQIEQEKPEIMQFGRRFFARQERLREALAALKAAREALGLSLDEVGERSGIGKANLSRLENARNPNPKIDTLARYAESVGRDLIITITGPTRPGRTAAAGTQRGRERKRRR